MEQTCSTKIISLHLEECKHGCPNEDACYLKKRIVSSGYPLPSSFKDDILEQGFLVYDALCRPLVDKDIERLKKYANYNVTISILDFKKGLRFTGSQIQLSLYSIQELDSIPEGALKLFLIKDKESLDISTFAVRSGTINNIHFNIDQGFLGNLGGFFVSNSNKKISVDSCYASWIINGECPYTTDYIDISYDWTVRKCPFSINGTPIPKEFITNKNYIDLFSLEHTPEECVYSKKFKELNGSQY